MIKTKNPESTPGTSGANDTEQEQILVPVCEASMDDGYYYQQDKYMSSNLISKYEDKLIDDQRGIIGHFIDHNWIGVIGAPMKAVQRCVKSVWSKLGSAKGDEFLNDIAARNDDFFDVFLERFHGDKEQHIKGKQHCF